MAVRTEKSPNRIKREIESILFAAGKSVTLEYLSKAIGVSEKRIHASVKELKEDYKESSLLLTEENNACKLTVKESYIPVVQDVVSETELPKSVMETLAVIAFKHPILQADLVRIRSNKCYDHLDKLVEQGFVKKEKFGRTYKVLLTQKFFDYFEVPPGKVKEAFASYEAVEKAIEEQEQHIELLRVEAEEQKSKNKEAQKMGELNVYESDTERPLPPQQAIIAPPVAEPQVTQELSPDDFPVQGEEEPQTQFETSEQPIEQEVTEDIEEITNEHSGQVTDIPKNAGSMDVQSSSITTGDVDDQSTEQAAVVHTESDGDTPSEDVLGDEGTEENEEEKVTRELQEKMREDIIEESHQFEDEYDIRQDIHKKSEEDEDENLTPEQRAEKAIDAAADQLMHGTHDTKRKDSRDEEFNQMSEDLQEEKEELQR
ncbi:SMC-Scp complex subunit ScpB [Candidatus Woesearchaeota archaeon]|nr:SMC-Scp complex subunit ScpB [Candidatus Woesearchaeota archaeon]